MIFIYIYFWFLHLVPRGFVILFCDRFLSLSLRFTKFCFSLFVSGWIFVWVMAKVRQSQRLLQARKWSTLMLVLFMLFMLTIVLLMLLAFGVFSLPINNNDESSPMDLSYFRRAATERCCPNLRLVWDYFVWSECFWFKLFFEFSEVRRDLGREEISGLKCSLGSPELSSTTTSWFVFLFQTKLLLHWMLYCLLCLNWCMFETKKSNLWEYLIYIIWCDQSKEECEYLISLAKPHMVKSTVVDSETGKSKDSRFAFLSFLDGW